MKVEKITKLATKVKRKPKPKVKSKIIGFNLKKETDKPKIKKDEFAKAKIDFEALKKLCEIQCSGEEMAGFFEVDYDTLVSYLKKCGYPDFRTFFQCFAAVGKISLRRKQYQIAMEGNVTMLSKLGDAWLGQYAKHEITSNDISTNKQPTVINNFNQKLAEDTETDGKRNN